MANDSQSGCCKCNGNGQPQICMCGNGAAEPEEPEGCPTICAEDKAVDPKIQCASVVSEPPQCCKCNDKNENGKNSIVDTGGKNTSIRKSDVRNSKISCCKAESVIHADDTNGTNGNSGCCKCNSPDKDEPDRCLCANNSNWDFNIIH